MIVEESNPSAILNLRRTCRFFLQTVEPIYYRLCVRRRFRPVSKELFNKTYLLRIDLDSYKYSDRTLDIAWNGTVPDHIDCKSLRNFQKWYVRRILSKLESNMVKSRLPSKQQTAMVRDRLTDHDFTGEWAIGLRDDEESLRLIDCIKKYR